MYTDPYEIYNLVMGVLADNFIDPVHMLRIAGQIQSDVDGASFWDSIAPEYSDVWPEAIR